jgi:translation elongation factor EF-Ts
MIEAGFRVLRSSGIAQADGLAERQAAQQMIVRRSPGARRIAVGADKAYDTSDFVADLRQLNVTPHVARNSSAPNRRSHPGVPPDDASSGRQNETEL